MGCLKVIVRNFVGLLAFTKWLLGFFILSFCLWTIATSSKLDQLIDGRLPVTYFLLGVGVLFLIDGAIGWAGVSKRSKVLVKLFLILSFFIFISEIGIILTLSIFKTNSTQVTDQLWLEMNPKSHQFIQEHLVCCGLNAPTDYDTSRDFDTSCYHSEQPALSSSGAVEQPDNVNFSLLNSLISSSSSSQLPATTKSQMNSDGCRQKIMEFAYDNRLYILLASASFMAYQMITMLLTASLNSLMGRSRRKSNMDSLEELDRSSGSGIHHHHQHHVGIHSGHGPSYM